MSEFYEDSPEYRDKLRAERDRAETELAKSYVVVDQLRAELEDARRLLAAFKRYLPRQDYEDVLRLVAENEPAKAERS